MVIVITAIVAMITHADAKATVALVIYNAGRKLFLRSDNAWKLNNDH